MCNQEKGKKDGQTRKKTTMVCVTTGGNIRREWAPGISILQVHFGQDCDCGGRRPSQETKLWGKSKKKRRTELPRRVGKRTTASTPNLTVCRSLVNQGENNPLECVKRKGKGTKTVPGKVKKKKKENGKKKKGVQTKISAEKKITMRKEKRRLISRPRSYGTAS